MDEHEDRVDVEANRRINVLHAQEAERMSILRESNARAEREKQQHIAWLQNEARIQIAIFEKIGLKVFESFKWTGEFEVIRMQINEHRLREAYDRLQSKLYARDNQTLVLIHLLEHILKTVPELDKSDPRFFLELKRLGVVLALSGLAGLTLAPFAISRNELWAIPVIFFVTLSLLVWLFYFRS